MYFDICNLVFDFKRSCIDTEYIYITQSKNQKFCLEKGFLSLCLFLFVFMKKER